MLHFTACQFQKMGYNVRAYMRKLVYMAGVASLALGSYSPATEGALLVDGAAVATPADTERVGQEFLKTTSDMWFLLSGIGNKEEADTAAPRFLELVQRVAELDELLSRLPMVPDSIEGASEDSDEVQVVGMMDGVHLRILEAFEDLNAEFLGLCRVRCYGSERLRVAFRQAVASGMFSEEDVDLLQTPPAPLDEEETRIELVRLKRLLPPDKALLEALELVQDAPTAREAAERLTELTERLQALLPESYIMNRSFADSSAAAVLEVTAPLEPILWGIRSEIVRIAALPGYNTEPFDSFSDALDMMFESLGETHSFCFETVFDASFRSDLDEAARTNMTSSN